MKNNDEKSNEQLHIELLAAQVRIAELEAAIANNENPVFPETLISNANNNGVDDKFIISEAKCRDIIDASPVPYALNDEHQNITYLNPAFTRVFGYDISDISTLKDWWPKAYPDPDYQQWVATTWQARLDEARLSGAPFEELEINVCCKDGSQRTVLVSVAPLSDSFKGNHLVILYDITERKKIEDSFHEQEKELAEIIDHIPSMIFLKDAKDLRFVRFNSAGEKLTGVSRDDLIGKNDYDFFPKEQADFFTERDRAVLASGELEDIPDEPIDTPDGMRSLHTRKVSIQGKDGKPKYLLGISDDITKQKEDKIERERLQRELHQAHKMESLGFLAGGIAHDFNNMLGIIIGYVNLCLETFSNNNQKKQIEYLRHIQAAGERASSLVYQMLAFSRNDQSNNKVLQLEPLIKEDIKLLRATLPSTIEIEIEIESGLPSVLINPTQLNQILLNMAVNARDAMSGAGCISFRLAWAKNLNTESTVSHKPIKGDWVELSITDTGCGIDPEIVDNIFTPFYTSKALGKGTGLGLSVVYGIMKGCNGHILLESEEGKGSSFRLLFPPVVEVTKKKLQTDSPATSSVKGKGEEILVVDDEESLANYIGDLIERFGYQATVVTDSTEAVAIYRDNPGRFSMLITDQTMPKLAGIELITQISGINPKLPVILCSGYSDKINSNILDSMNINYFDKPVDSKTLIQRVGELLISVEKGLH